jgi:hypothetical protein
MAFAQLTDHDGQRIGDPFEVSDNVLWSTPEAIPATDVEPEVEFSIEIRGTGTIESAYAAASDTLRELRAAGSDIDYSSIHTCPACTCEPASDPSGDCGDPF